MKILSQFRKKEIRKHCNVLALWVGIDISERSQLITNEPILKVENLRICELAQKPPWCTLIFCITSQFYALSSKVMERAETGVLK